MPETSGDNLHVMEEALDFLEHRLSPERGREVSQHLEVCRECAEHYAFVGELQVDVAGHGVRHLRPERLVLLAEGPDEAATSEERLHLEACGSCERDLSWARTAPLLADWNPEGSTGRIETAEAAPSSDWSDRQARDQREAREAWTERLRRTVRIPTWGWASLAAGVAGLFLVLQLQKGPESHPLALLAQIEPLPPAQVERGGQGAPAFRRLFLEAMKAYAARDFEEAEPLFAQAAAAAPDEAEPQLYLGSCRLLLGRAEEAIQALERALKAAGPRRLKEEAQWQLANAHLAAGGTREAEALLRELAAQGTDRRDKAATLLAVLHEALQQEESQPRGD